MMKRLKKKRTQTEQSAEEKAKEEAEAKAKEEKEKAEKLAKDYKGVIDDYAKKSRMKER